ncbi:dienelactone hydrolase family protein [Parendozoicomonas haliclonae]|uniref:Alpha/beta hydrolase family protein n=1 Tax=Parendozoicomonas haliclonae TaxID=1960125 RepID=A0A1X7ADZ0_9GAMM|nr:dienelactone hydrolase family protein [Parendozoicomonas haliclonae]SMA32587.1 Alpha/beta hydrolase family protein [Parendozoicomonas haliclonae]
MSPAEFSQYLMMIVMSWLTPSGDLYDAACIGTNLIFREYHQAICPVKKPWSVIQQELDYELYYPGTTDNGKRYPLIILFHGASGAHSQSMDKRRHYFLQQGYAVMVPDSFSHNRVMESVSKHSGSLYAPEAMSGEAAFADQPQLESVFERFSDKVSQGMAMLPAVRAADVLVSLEFALSKSHIDPDNIHLVGYSHGASAILEAGVLSALGKTIPGAEDTADLGLFEKVKSASLYYPSCRPGNYYPWHGRWPVVPAFMLLASEDELCRPALCQKANRQANSFFPEPLIEETIFRHKHNFDMPEYPENYAPDDEVRAREQVLGFIRRHSSGWY